MEEELICKCKKCQLDFDCDDMVNESVCYICEYKNEKKHEIKEFNRLLKKHSYLQEEELNDLAYNLHTQSNCHCEFDDDTFTLTSDGAGDIEMCLNCFGAKGYVY